MGVSSSSRLLSTQSRFSSLQYPFFQSPQFPQPVPSLFFTSKDLKMMRSISLFFLLSASVQFSASQNDFMFYMNTAGAYPEHCKNNFPHLNITLDAIHFPSLLDIPVGETLVPAGGTTVADAIDAVIDLCSGQGTGAPHQRTGPPDGIGRNLRHAGVTPSRELKAALCSTSCGCQKSLACQLGGYCADTCWSCSCERRLQDTFEDANEGIVQDHVETQRELQNQMGEASKIRAACTSVMSALSAQLNSKDNYCLGESVLLGIYVNVY